MLKDITLQVFWAIVILTLGKLVWESVQTHIISQGG